MTKIMTILTTVILAIVLCGCNTQNNDSIITEPTATKIITTSPLQTSTQVPIESDTEIEVMGQYIGLIDGNSFEAVIDSVPMAFRHDNCQDFIEENEISDGDTVTIIYTRSKQEQNMAISIVKEEPKKISVFFPAIEDMHKFYIGEGNEYAQYETIVEFINQDTIQIKTDNTGTCTVNVYKITNNSVRKVYTESEIYDVVDLTGVVNKDEIILMTPIMVGTTWTLQDNAKRTITAVDKAISTPYSDFIALEVQTKRDTSTIYDYYVEGIGHVMSVFEDNEVEGQITSKLGSMENSVESN